jgi:beta-glucosidase
MKKKKPAAKSELPKANSITRKDFLKKSAGALGLLALPGFLTSCSDDNRSSKHLSKQVKELIGKMNLQEKVSQLEYEAPAIPRLDIPKYTWWNECLHGVARAGLATVFPQAIGLAATWDTPLMHKTATAISDEARAKHNAFVKRGIREIYTGLTFWAPNINLVRDPRWGRGQETYGEDPYLTGQMAVNFVQGLQGDDPDNLKLVGTPKHFAAYSGPEPKRHKIDVEVSPQDLHASYLPQFRMAVEQANAESVMCAYNGMNGMPCCGNNPLLEGILRNDFNFEGYIVSDCGAISDIWKKTGHHIVDSAPKAAALALKSGTDLNCGSTYRKLNVAVKKGLIKEEKLDQSLQRLFEARYRLGMIKGKEKGPYTDIPYSVVSSQKHKKLSREMSRESIVLLKNESPDDTSNPMLPLSGNIKKLAVIGPNADDKWTMLGNYHGTPDEIITPLNGIRAKAAEKDMEVQYALGCDTIAERHSVNVIASKYLTPSKGAGLGLYGEYFDNKDFEGAPSKKQVDKKIDFTWRDDTPVTGEMADSFSVRWTGKLLAPKTGTYVLSVKAKNKCKFYLDGEKKAEAHSVHDPVERRVKVDLEAGKKYDVKIGYVNQSPDPQVHFYWSEPHRNLTEKAVEAAKNADAVVLCLGLNSRLEGEEMLLKIKGFNHGDKTNLKIPKPQVRLMQKLHALGKPTVLVVLTGSAVTFPWAEQNIPSIMQAWYGGQEGGHAIADVLFGDYNPAGRLPVTFYESVEDVPDFTDYSMKGRTYRYFKGKPLFPFGYGLSYTTFEYSNLQLPQSVKKGQSLQAKVTVKNTGDVAGDEVVQLYVSHPNTKTKHKPIRSLKGFKRIHLKAGEAKTVRFKLDSRQFSLVDESGSSVIPTGELDVSLGGKQPGFSGRTDAQTTEVLQKRVSIA